jgi:YVTN family beta-propeller protein
MSRLLIASLLLATTGGLTPPRSPRGVPAGARQKLYVLNTAGDDVTVIDVARNKVLGTVVVGKHPHGVAVPAAADFLLVTVEGTRPGQLVWIDPRTDRVRRRMDVGPAPNQLAVTPDGKWAYVPCADGHWDVVDVSARKVAGRIETGGRPHNTLCSPDGKRMYLAPTGSPRRVTVVDTAKKKKVGQIAFSGSVRPIALDVPRKRFYANVDGLVGFEVADLKTGKVVHRVAAELTEAQKKVKSRSHGLAIEPGGKEMWECDVENKVVRVWDLGPDRPRQAASIPLGGRPYWLTFGPDGKRCYVAVGDRSEVAVVDAPTRKVLTRIRVGKVPKRLVVVPVKD